MIFFESVIVSWRGDKRNVEILYNFLFFIEPVIYTFSHSNTLPICDAHSPFRNWFKFIESIFEKSEKCFECE
jgi:hypothetical protein